MTRGLGTLLLTPAPTCVLSAVVEAGEAMEKSVAIEIPVDFMCCCIWCILYLDMHIILIDACTILTPFIFDIYMSD